MRILQISSAPVSYYGGTEKVVWEISKKLVEKNDVTILQSTLYAPKKVSGTVTKDKVKIITRKNDRFLGGYGYSKEFKNTLKKIWKDFDVVHVHGYGRFTSDFSLKFLKNKKPIIFTAHGFFHSKKAATFKKVHNKVKGRLLKNAVFCTALTELEEKQYLERGVKRNKIRVVPDGVDLNQFKGKKDLGLKEKYSKGKKIILYLGGINESKGLQHVVKAIKNLDVKFLIFGVDRGYQEKLKKIVKELGLEKKVVFGGFVEERIKHKYYSIADIFVLFSEWEGFGLSLIEAMASGKPSIVSDKGSLPFLVKNGENGLIVKYPHVEELEEAINTLLIDNKKRVKIGKEARKFSKNFGWDFIVKKYEKIYSEAGGNLNG
jgi:glycosyltransferase involved in cell wall biosynthesis